jgi:outer membrane protein assembly factor BamE (lipoprotein component of BamABCDE complex)
MARQGSGIKRAVILVCLLALAACTTIYRNHGYVPREEDLAKVVVGESTAETVGRDVGRPSSTGLLTGGAWYYVGSRFRHYAGRAPKEVDRQVVAISFDDKGVVENVERFGLEKGEVVVISRRVTDSNIKGVGFLRQLLGNIGNFNAGQFLDQNN